ncbi:MAG: hypothetical protein CVU11_10240 [Bacteroidetes bacterium HGW-Bacteroidetes-6]|jgi:hypothetical protein|nr:MAG: hypothetical protein CVU11_10240 [Bacteroidetes bacterium HGW-Bacteroidetes-6]
MRKISLAIFLIVAFAGIVGAQNIEDTVTVVHSPQKATIMSACLPGLGQVYNRKYWKVPVIYAGLGGAGYAIGFNNNLYKDYRSAYIARTDGDSTTVDPFVGHYTETNLLDLRNYYRHNLELSVIILSAVYILNIVDAAVDANLYDFDISDDLSLSFHPALWNAGSAFCPSIGGGFTIRINLRP